MAVAEDGGFWVFAYGSLMWDPGFAFVERRQARLSGYRRSFRLRSLRYRGTPELPGLVLGLDWDPNASCAGVAFRVAGPETEPVRDYLAERELITRSYFEVYYPVVITCPGPGQGAPVNAICYVLDRTHEQYAGPIGLEEQAETIARAEGPRGPNWEYLYNTAEKLAAEGLPDPDLARLASMVRDLRGEA
ncbi:MAG: gamma-glutamylcyclotransferase [Pseudomonadota bacterium]